jgi:hypothetical protein
MYPSMLAGRQRILQHKGAGLAAYVPNSHREAGPCQQGENSRQPVNGVHRLEVARSASIAHRPVIGVLCQLNGRATNDACARVPTSK